MKTLYLQFVWELCLFAERDRLQGSVNFWEISPCEMYLTCDGPWAVQKQSPRSSALAVHISSIRVSQTSVSPFYLHTNSSICQGYLVFKFICMGADAYYHYTVQTAGDILKELLPPNMDTENGGSSALEVIRKTNRSNC